MASSSSLREPLFSIYRWRSHQGGPMGAAVPVVCCQRVRLCVSPNQWRSGRDDAVDLRHHADLGGASLSSECPMASIWPDPHEVPAFPQTRTRIGRARIGRARIGWCRRGREPSLEPNRSLEKILANFSTYPSQRPSSFSIDQIVEKMQHSFEAAGSN